jgi:CheY-like chemotaxis protein
MEGMETIEAFRKKCPTLKIIAMSGGGRISATDYLKIAKIMGADMVLSKPFANAAVIQAVEQVFAAGKA